jgi:hypothetical protein
MEGKMIKDFEIVKLQLQELSSVINGFKSEAVQLKIVELLFQRMGIKTENTEKSEMASTGRKKPPRRKRTASDSSEKKSRKQRVSKGGRPGPGAIVKQLSGEGFFKKPKTIQDIINHCQSKFAYTYNSSELAVSVTRALRGGSLKRQKNAQNQFEYHE